jgi:hypothetical protein
LKNERALLALAITGGLAIYTATVFAFFSNEGESRQLFLFLLGVPPAIFLLAFPRAALIVLAVMVYFVRWLYDTVHVLPREATWMVDILIVMLVLRTLFSMPFHKEKLTGIIKFAFVIVAFAILSAIVNRTDKLVFVAGIRAGFRYIFLFIAAYEMKISLKWLTRYLLFLFFICLAQFPAIISQYFQYHLLDPDRLSGTFGWGETPGMGYFLLLLVSYLLAKMIEERRFRLTYLAAILLMSVLPIFGEVKFYYMVMPLLLFLIIRADVLKRPSMAALVVLIVVMIVTGANYAIIHTGAWAEGNNPVTFVENLPHMFEKEIEKEDYGEATRTSMFLHALHQASVSPRMIALGEGPGAITLSGLVPNETQKMAYYARWGLTSFVTSAFCWLIIEYGYVGVGLFFVLFHWIFRRAAYLRSSEDITTRVFGRTLECITFLYVAWVFYVQAWVSDVTSFTFWPIAGILVSASYTEQAVQEKAALARIKVAAQGPEMPAAVTAERQALPGT